MNGNGNHTERLWTQLIFFARALALPLIIRLFRMVFRKKCELKAKQRRLKGMQKEEEKLTRGIEDSLNNPLVKGLLVQVIVALLKFVLDWAKEDSDPN